jgi:hypothetical protein
MQKRPKSKQKFVKTKIYALHSTDYTATNQRDGSWHINYKRRLLGKLSIGLFEPNSNLVFSYEDMNQIVSLLHSIKLKPLQDKINELLKN